MKPMFAVLHGYWIRIKIKGYGTEVMTLAPYPYLLTHEVCLLTVPQLSTKVCRVRQCQGFKLLQNGFLRNSPYTLLTSL